MRRFLLLLGMVVAITLSGSAANAEPPECYYARIPVPDGGDRIQVEVCPMP